MAVAAFLRPLLRFGTGVAIQIDGPKGGESLRIAVVRVRPSGAQLLAHYTVEDFLNQPADVWGTEYTAFLKQYGIPQVAATVVLPRHEIIVRVLPLPGVRDKDLDAAVQFQMDGLHPYREEDVAASWTRLPGTDQVLVGIARHDQIERYMTAFAEAGIKISSFTASAAVLYSAIRLFQPAPSEELLASQATPEGAIEIYAESPSKPLLSSLFSVEADRAAGLAASEMRFKQAPARMSFEALVGVAPALPFAAGLAAACPRLFLPLNLLPESARQGGSLVAWLPSAAIGALVLLLAGALLAYPRLDESRQRKAINAELEKLQPLVNRANTLDREIQNTQKQTADLDNFRLRAKTDMDILAEVTKLLPPPTWLNSFDLNDKQLNFSGETEQAAPLLRILDGSPLFAGSEFAMPPIRIAGGEGRPSGEAFRVRSNREGPALAGMQP